MCVESKESIDRYNAGGPWHYTGGYRIERAWGNIYYIVGPDGENRTIAGLGMCHEWLTSRGFWPVIIKGGA